MVFLLIYSLYWIIFWQEFIIIPYYVTDYISKEAPYEIIQSWAGGGRHHPLPDSDQSPHEEHPHAPGDPHWLRHFIAASGSSSGSHPSIPTIAAGIVAFSIGEMMQAPRYYEYISEIAPPGQQGLFQGYAFLPDCHRAFRR